MLGVLLLREGVSRSMPSMCADMPISRRLAIVFASTATRKRARSPGSIKFRNGTEKNFLSPITTKPWGQAIPQLADVSAPTQEMRDSQLLYNEPKYIRMDEGGLHTLEAAGLKLKEGVYY